MSLQLNKTRLKLSLYICIFLEVPIARTSPNGFYMGILALCFSFIDYLISVVL